MIDWIRRQMRNVLAGGADLADAVSDTIVGVIRTLFAIFGAVRHGWSFLTTAFLLARHVLTEFGQDVYDTLKAITTKLIPRVIANIMRDVRRLLDGLNAALRHYILAKLHDLAEWAQRAISLVNGALVAFRRWAIEHIWEALRFVRDTGARVADLVLHPEKLAKWLLPHILGPLLRFLDSRAEAIGKWLLGRSVNAMLGAAHRIEDVIARLL